MAYAQLISDRNMLDIRLGQIAVSGRPSAAARLMADALAIRGRLLWLEAATSRLLYVILKESSQLQQNLKDSLRAMDDANTLRADASPSVEACIQALDTQSPPIAKHKLLETLKTHLQPGEVAIFFERYQRPKSAALPIGAHAPAGTRDAGTLALMVGVQADQTAWHEVVHLAGTAAEQDRQASRVHKDLSLGRPSEHRRSVAQWALHPLLDVLERRAGTRCERGQPALRLAIAPDAELYGVPFYALPINKTGARLLIDGPCTVRRIAGLRDLLPSAVPPAEGLFAAAQAVQSGSIVVASRGASKSYGRLARANDEVVQVAKILRHNGVLGVAERSMPVKSINKAKLLDGLSEAPAFVHLAMHGDFISDPNPADRRLGLDGALLVVGSTSSAPADKYLNAREIMRSLNLWGTQLVFLSACHSGRGLSERGEGIYGLPRAFHAAGAQRVIASLWRVKDADAHAFAQAFYSKLFTPKAPDAPNTPSSSVSPPAGDFERAFKAALQEQRAKYPIARWAAFVLSGRGGTLQRPTASHPLNPPAACQDNP
jgi:CHAT domain-containing protein